VAWLIPSQLRRFEKDEGTGKQWRPYVGAGVLQNHTDFGLYIHAGGELYIKSFYTFGPQSTWHIKIKMHLAIPNNMHVISVKHFHKKTINDKI